MPKHYSARTVLSALQKAGFSILSQRGSHIKLSKRTSLGTLTVIVPNHKELAIGTFSSILKQANMERKDFEKLIN